MKSIGVATRAVLALLLAPAVVTFTSLGIASAQDAEPPFTTEFRFSDYAFKTEGANPYFILKPGYRLVLTGQEDGARARLTITVLGSIERVFVPDIGTVRTRVVEERHFLDGVLVERSRNFFAICDKTNDVVYFGEAVDIFNSDGTITHDGSWRAGVDGAVPGIIMPGTFLLGARYFQEQAPNAMDRAEHVAMGLAVATKAGTFQQCVQVLETTPLEPDASSLKVYCPGVGLVDDSGVTLVKFGFIHGDD